MGIIILWRLRSCLTSDVAFLLFPPQGAEPEEADLPADSHLRPLWPTRVSLGGAQKACLLNTHLEAERDASLWTTTASSVNWWDIFCIRKK